MTKGERITARIVRKLTRIDALRMEIIRDVMALNIHSKNRIAAHKAHLTMAKRKTHDHIAEKRPPLR